MKSIATLVFIGAIIGPGIYGCGYAASTAPTSGNNPNPTSGYNPTPTITTILPNSALAGGVAFRLTCGGCL